MHTAIDWFTRNVVAANLLMFMLLLGGVLSLFTVHQESFPNVDAEIVSITVPYLGAAPEEVELGVCLRIEEAVRGIEGTEKINTTANEGVCRVNIELIEDLDTIIAFNKIKSEVDGIITFPVETEKPIVSKLVIRSGVMQIAISGNASESTLKELGKTIRDDIAALSGISQVDLQFVRPYEISIEVSEYSLRKHNLTLLEIANAVRKDSLDMPGGALKTASGEILLRTKGQLYTGEDYQNIVVLTRVDGTQLTLGEIAEIKDGFEEGDLRARMNNNPAVMVKVSRIGKEDITSMSDDIQNYLLEARRRMPEGITLTVWNDESTEMVERIDTLVWTAATGLLLVFVILALFLRFKIALWVAAGIPIALLGGIAVFPYAGISISTLTVMAFILVLGIVVDDAIVVGERVYAHEQKNKHPIRAAIDGTNEVSVPVIFGVLTTMAAFLPLIIVPGRMGDFFSVIGWVVIICLLFSVVESQLILPAHLAHRNRKPSTRQFAIAWNRFQDKLSAGLEGFADNVYQPALDRTIRWRYVTAASGVAVLILALALIMSGRVIFQFFPAIEGNRIFAVLELPEGIAIERTIEATKQLELAAEVLRKELDSELSHSSKSVIKNIFTSIGTTIPKSGPPRPSGPGRSHFAEVAIELVSLSDRDDRSAEAISKRWRELVGPIPEAVKLSYSSAAFSAGEAINFQLAGKNVDELRSFAAQLRAELGRFDGVFDISDSFRAGKQEIKLMLLPNARNFNITLNDLAQQVRYAFYGVEAQRIQRGQDDVRVMVRYPEKERNSIGNLEEMRIRAPSGVELPFSSVARFELGRGYSSIKRIDGQRVVNVTADLDRNQLSPEAVIASIEAEILPDLLLSHPQVSISQAGEQEERAKSLAGLAQAAVLALFIIFMLLAIPLRSYVQPMVIMSVIPFGAVGAIVGHYVMGWPLVFFSLLGIIALSGVVVNASLVLVDYINRRRREGVTVEEAVRMAGVVRFRPIILTSVTTFVGLLPLMATANPSTAFIIPMAISLAFGVLFATTITLFLVPSLYMISEDIFGWGEGSILTELDTGKMR